MTTPRDPKPGECWRNRRASFVHVVVREVDSDDGPGAVVTHEERRTGEEGATTRASFVRNWSLCTEHPPKERAP